MVLCCCILKLTVVFRCTFFLLFTDSGSGQSYSCMFVSVSVMSIPHTFLLGLSSALISLLVLSVLLSYQSYQSYQSYCLTSLTSLNSLARIPVLPVLPVKPVNFVHFFRYWCYYIEIQGTTPNCCPKNLGTLVSGMGQLQWVFGT